MSLPSSVNSFAEFSPARMSNAFRLLHIRGSVAIPYCRNAPKYLHPMTWTGCLGVSHPPRGKGERCRGTLGRGTPTEGNAGEKALRQEVCRVDTISKEATANGELRHPPETILADEEPWTARPPHRTKKKTAANDVTLRAMDTTESDDSVDSRKVLPAPTRAPQTAPATSSAGQALPTCSDGFRHGRQRPHIFLLSARRFPSIEHPRESRQLCAQLRHGRRVCR